MDYKDLLTYMVQQLVDDPSAINIAEIEGEKSTILELSVAKDDIGKVIGKNGRIARAIRTLLSASAMESDKRVVLEILD